VFNPHHSKTKGKDGDIITVHHYIETELFSKWKMETLPLFIMTLVTIFPPKPRNQVEKDSL
jgi:hypothetical protein